MMQNNILGDLLLFKTMKLKPNFSELSRLYNIDRHTIAKYWKHGGITKMTRQARKSKLDPYLEEIIQLLKKPGVSKRAAYEYLEDKYGQDTIGTYNNFRSYTYTRDIQVHKTIKPHVRYETRPGQQLQVDWKEDLKLTTKHGEVIQFHLMTSTLGYSRQHVFIYTKTKTTEDFLRCMIDTLQYLGGVPQHILTDNMAAVVSITNGTKRKHTKIQAFEKDIDCKIKLCKARSPQTKGKDESANRFVSWLNAYDGEIEDEQELVNLLCKINRKVNESVNQTTQLPPLTLFQKEKEYLKPLPNKVLLDSYVDTVTTQIVPPTLLVTYQGSGYSVPLKYINKRIKMIAIDNKLYLYFNTELITVHQIQRNKFNYQLDHYQEALHQSIHNKEVDIEKIAKENLELLEKIRR